MVDILTKYPNKSQRNGRKYIFRPTKNRSFTQIPNTIVFDKTKSLNYLAEEFYFKSNSPGFIPTPEFLAKTMNISKSTAREKLNIFLKNKIPGKKKKKEEKKPEKFSAIPNQILRNFNLSKKSRYLITFLSTIHQERLINPKQIVNCLKNEHGKRICLRTVFSAFKELEKSGHLLRKKNRCPLTGKFENSEYYFFISPLDDHEKTLYEKNHKLQDILDFRGYRATTFKNVYQMQKIPKLPPYTRDYIIIIIL